MGVALTLTLASGRRNPIPARPAPASALPSRAHGRRRTAPSSYGIRPALVSRYGRQRKNRHPKEKGSGSRGGKLGRSTVSHRNEAGGAQVQSTQDGCGQPYPASRDMTTPFPFGFLPTMLWDIKPRGNGRPWGMEPAVEDTDGRSVSDRTRPHFFLFGFCSTRSPYRGTGFRYRIRLLPGLACGILPDGTIPWR